MARARKKRSIPQRRRERAQRNTRQRRQQRLLVQSGLAASAVVVLLLGVWWFIGRSELAAGEALHQFDTQDFHSLAFDPDDADTVYFGHHEGLMMSDDGGETWADTALSGVDAMQLAMPRGEPERRYVAGHDVFYVSTDAGQSWSEQPNDLPGLDLHAFAASSSGPDRLYAIPLGNGLWTSADGGVAWAEATMPAGAETQPIALAVSPSDSETVYLARNGEIAVSTDGGVTWESTPGPGGIITTLAVASDEDETLYAGTNQGTYRLENSWRRLSLKTDGVVVTLAVNANDPDRVAVIDLGGNFYRSDDAGTSWQMR